MKDLEYHIHTDHEIGIYPKGPDTLVSEVWCYPSGSMATVIGKSTKIHLLDLPHEFLGMSEQEALTKDFMQESMEEAKADLYNKIRAIQTELM